MILTCPSCATSYFTPDEAIGAMGRRVRCKACTHTWHASLSDEPLELSESTQDPALQAQAGFGKRDDAPESLAETPAPELPKAFRARAEQQRRMRRAATHGAVWAGLASMFVAILGAAWLFRVDVVEVYPRAAAAYAMVGMPVNPVGLQFEAVGAKPSPRDPALVLVSGALRNVRDREVVAPAVRLALLDAHGAEIGFRIVAIDAAPVLPGGVQGFAALIPDPGAKAAGVGVDFVTPAKLKGGHGAASETHAAEDHATGDHGAAADHAPAVRRPPQAEEEGGLRPAMSHETPEPSLGAPVDARPIATPVSTNAVDAHHGEAVSSSHHG